MGAPSEDKGPSIRPLPGVEGTGWKNQSDNEGEYSSKWFEAYLKSEGYVTSAPFPNGRTKWRSRKAEPNAHWILSLHVAGCWPSLKVLGRSSFHHQLLQKSLSITCSQRNDTVWSMACNKTKGGASESFWLWILRSHSQGRTTKVRLKSQKVHTIGIWRDNKRIPIVWSSPAEGSTQQWCPFQWRRETSQSEQWVYSQGWHFWNSSYCSWITTRTGNWRHRFAEWSGNNSSTQEIYERMPSTRLLQIDVQPSHDWQGTFDLYSLSSAARESVWLGRLTTELGQVSSHSTTIYEDNQSAISMCKNPHYHGRAKHIDIHHHYIREQVSSKTIEVKYCPTDKMAADIFTKGLTREQFCRLREKIGILQFD